MWKWLSRGTNLPDENSEVNEIKDATKWDSAMPSSVKFGSHGLSPFTHLFLFICELVDG